MHVTLIMRERQRKILDVRFVTRRQVCLKIMSLRHIVISIQQATMAFSQNSSEKKQTSNYREEKDNKIQPCNQSNKSKQAETE